MAASSHMSWPNGSSPDGKPAFSHSRLGRTQRGRPAAALPVRDAQHVFDKKIVDTGAE